MVASLGIERAVVPERFPLGIGDRLRADGVELVVDQRFFDDRRRRKSDFELAGIRIAQKAAEAGHGGDRRAARRARSRATAAGSSTASRSPASCSAPPPRTAFAELGCRGDDMIVAHGTQAADGHEPGHGRVENDDTVLCDLFPQHFESACFADMTRTFRVGAADPTLTEWHAQSVEALELAIAMVRPGIEGGAIHKAVCAFFEERGHMTQSNRPRERFRTKGSITASATASGSRSTRRRA